MVWNKYCIITKSRYLCSFRRLIYLLWKQIYTERKRVLSSAGSQPKWQQGWGWVRAEPGAKSLFQISSTSCPTTCAILCWFSSPLAYSWIKSWEYFKCQLNPTMSVPKLKFYRFIYLKDRGRQTEKEEIFHLLIHSQNVHNCWELNRLQP